ncbi:MAG: hypothetical protein WAM91_16465 [Candidatus Acidiferrales bacterium]
MRPVHHFAAILLASLISGVSNGHAQGQAFASVSGFVVDEGGLHVEGVKVRAWMVGGPHNSSVQYFESDKNGHYLIDHLGFGTYKLFTKKEESRYPDTMSAFYSNDSPTIKLNRYSPNATVDIHLGPKAGLLIGIVQDAVSAAPVNASFKLAPADAPERWLSTSEPANYSVLLPADTGVLLEISAPGYVTWHYGGPSDPQKRSPLRLKSGSETHLDIAMEPMAGRNLPSSKFLIPEGFVGWVILEYDLKNADRAPSENGTNIYKFPPSGVLKTSSPGPQLGAQDQYFLYPSSGAMRPLASDYRNGKGLIWGQYEGFVGGEKRLFGFFIGTEDEYKKHPRPTATR